MGETPTGNTGPVIASDGDWYMYVEANDGVEGDIAILNSPCFDLTTVSLPTFSFDYHMRGTGNSVGTLVLEASDDNGDSWTFLWSQDGNAGSSWVSQNVDISAYEGGSLQFRFTGTIGSGEKSDIAIDNISIVSSPPPPPSFSTVKETYITTSSKQLGATTVNNLAQSASILVNMELNAGVTYRFAVRGREWLTNNVATGSFGKNTSGYSGNTVNTAQRGTMTITLIKQR